MQYRTGPEWVLEKQNADGALRKVGYVKIRPTPDKRDDCTGYDLKGAIPACQCSSVIIQLPLPHFPLRGWADLHDFVRRSSLLAG